jgi:hypothetical protein
MVPIKSRKTCSKCGSIYEISEYKMMVRDSDEISCEVCGTELISWNGGVMYSKKLIQRAEWPHKDSIDNTKLV